MIKGVPALISFIIMFTLVSTDGTSSSQSIERIIEKAENSIKGKTSHALATMTVKTSSYTRKLKMESWWVENEKALIVILEPRKERGNKTLKIGNQLWNYLKNTETTIKIPPSMMLQSWNGSDFTNDDLVRESSMVKDYFQKLLGTETMDSVECWKVELTPKPDAAVVWGRLHYWISVSDTLPIRINYYDEKGRLMRHMTFTEVKKMGGRKLPTVWTMINDRKKNHRTTFTIENIEFDIKIPNRVFSLRELEKGD